jgi:hypothetical protein
VTIGNIYRRICPSVASRFDIIWGIAHDDSEILVIAAFQALRHIVGSQREFQQFLSEEKCWRDFLARIPQVSFRQKAAIAQFLFLWLRVANDDDIEEMVDDGLLGLLGELLEFEGENLINQTISTLDYLMFRFEQLGSLGWFEIAAVQCISMEIIERIIHCGDQRVSRPAAILHSKLWNLPNGAFRTEPETE